VRKPTHWESHLAEQSVLTAGKTPFWLPGPRSDGAIPQSKSANLHKLHSFCFSLCRRREKAICAFSLQNSLATSWKNVKTRSKNRRLPDFSKHKLKKNVHFARFWQFFHHKPEETLSVFVLITLPKSFWRSGQCVAMLCPQCEKVFTKKESASLLSAKKESARKKFCKPIHKKRVCTKKKPAAPCRKKSLHEKKARCPVQKKESARKESLQAGANKKSARKRVCTKNRADSFAREFMFKLLHADSLSQ